MRRKDKEITDQKLIHDILEKAEICRLGLVENAEAYIVPVNFAYYKGAIFIHSAMQGRKIEILKKNNRVAFEVEAHTSIETGLLPCEWSAKYRSVMGRGTVELEVNTEQKKQALDLIMKKYGWGSNDLSYDEALLSRVCILKLHIESTTGKQSGNWE